MQRKMTGVIAVLFGALVFAPPSSHSQNPVAPQSSAAPHNSNLPLFFMQPPEVAIGVTRHPFYATVSADWSLAVPGGGSLHREAKGNIWRDAAGNVRLDDSEISSGSAASDSRVFGTLLITPDGTQTS